MLPEDRRPAPLPDQSQTKRAA